MKNKCSLRTVKGGKFSCRPPPKGKVAGSNPAWGTSIYALLASSFMGILHAAVALGHLDSQFTLTPLSINVNT